MQMFVLVLNREEFLEPLLEEMLKQNIGGATILESTGMMRVLDGDHNIDDLPVLGGCATCAIRNGNAPRRFSRC